VPEVSIQTPGEWNLDSWFPTSCRFHSVPQEQNLAPETSSFCNYYFPYRLRGSHPSNCPAVQAITAKFTLKTVELHRFCIDSLRIQCPSMHTLSRPKRPLTGKNVSLERHGHRASRSRFWRPGKPIIPRACIHREAVTASPFTTEPTSFPAASTATRLATRPTATEPT